jgi:hypothetical protein
MFDQCFSNFNMNAKVQKLALDMGKIVPSSPTFDGDMVCVKFSYIGTGPRGAIQFKSIVQFLCTEESCV